MKTYKEEVDLHI